NVSHSPANDFEPAWSPDGNRIAFARFVGNAGDVWVMNADGSNQVRLTTSAADDEEPAWSPDGSKILFKSTRDGGAQIYVMNADGSGQHVLVTSGDYDAEPSWSAVGTGHGPRRDGHDLACRSLPLVAEARDGSALVHRRFRPDREGDGAPDCGLGDHLAVHAPPRAGRHGCARRAGGCGAGTIPARL